MDTQFKDIEVGTVFVFNGVKYTKIADERVSCCRVLNAENAETKEKSMILPLENIQVEK